MDAEIFIGWDSRQIEAWRRCAWSILRHSDYAPPLRAIGMTELVEAGHYRRPTEQREGVLWDAISEEPMSTEFSLARFFVPFVSSARHALYVDCDFLFRTDVADLLGLADERFAVQVVKHEHRPAETEKMDGQRQTAYARKNWSSCVIWNLRHAATRRLDFHELNTRHKHWLHGFRWLEDSQIGELPHEWNWIEGVSSDDVAPKAVHFSRGLPDVPGYEDSRYAKEWRACAPAGVPA